MATHAREAEPTFVDKLKFLTGFVKSPLEVGSPIATFPRTIERLLAPVNWSKIRCFVEYGPGAGEFTRYILQHLPANAQLIAIESDEGLGEHLRETLEDDRLTVYTRSAAEAPDLLGEEGPGKIDYILSGIPFSAISGEERETIVSDAARLLRSDGMLLAYQVRRSMDRHLQNHFSAVRRRRAWLNLPPYHLYWCSKPRPK